jgi:hypothetical protein
MPTGPKGQKRPADVIGNAVRVMQIATGEVSETVILSNAAAELGRMGGKARAKKLGKEQRSEIARNAAKSRWADHKGSPSSSSSTSKSG